MTTNNPSKEIIQPGTTTSQPQDVQLRPAPIWSKALAWTIIATASFGFVYAVFAELMRSSCHR